MLSQSSRDALQVIRDRTSGRRVVFVSGNFNIIHPGHLRLLRFARECGDFLVVGVLGAGSPGATVPEGLRLEGVEAINWVDYGFLLEEPAVEFLKALKPAVVVKGKEHEDKFNAEAEVVRDFGGRLLFGSGDVSFSSVDLMRKEWRELNLSTIKKPTDYLVRHGIGATQLAELLQRMSGLSVCVVGDLIVDEYVTCEPLGMSREDPTIVVTPIVREKFVGGAGIVGAHARSLGARVTFFSILGKDEAAEYARRAVEGFGVEGFLYEDESRPTPLKQRYRAAQKTLLRVSHLRQHAISSDIRLRMRDAVLGALGGTDLLIFADFNYGCLPQPLVDEISAECLRRGVMMVADSQSSSQVGDVSRFRDMALLTPTEREARIAVHDSESGLVILAEKIKSRSRARNVVITLGGEGVLVHAEINERNGWLTDRLPALNVAPKDVAGAGDSFLTCMSMAMAAGGDIWQGAYLGSLAAACQVGRIGNIPLTADELRLEIIT